MEEEATYVYELSSPPHKGETKEKKKKKKKKSKHAEGEIASANSHDGGYHVSSPTTDEEGEGKSPRKRKAKKKCREDSEHSSRKSKPEEAGLTEAKMLGVLPYRSSTVMSKKVDENYVYDNDDDGEAEDRRCPPPQLVTPPEFIPDMAAQAKENIQEFDMEAKKATAAQTLALAEEEDRKSPPPQLIPSLKWDEEWVATAQKLDAAAIKEAPVLFDEKEMIKGVFLDASSHPIQTTCGWAMREWTQSMMPWVANQITVLVQKQWVFKDCLKIQNEMNL